MTTRLTDHLRRRAIAWAGQITKLAKELAPAHIKPYIHSHIEDKEDGGIIVRTTVNRFEKPLPKYGSMDARAQEYGSGLRARRGTKEKYIIAPKNGPVLIFPWQKLQKVPNSTWFGGEKLMMKNEKGAAVFHYVEHPGIQAANGGQGYIAPAQREIRKRAKAELGKDVRDAILGDLRESFGRRVK